MYNPEILAPCGELSAVIAAINAGADAVYLGADKFSARAYANNFTSDEIKLAINYAHIYGKKVYLTLNTLIKNDEIDEALELVKEVYLAGLDAVIVQDLGLMSSIANMFPDLDIHASTQMSVMSSEAIRFLKKYNVSRVVPARELTAKEISELKAEGLEIECFVHGAMCYSYSGKCLFSSIAGGRSGNRGRCAGPCRKSYKVYSQDGKLIKDTCYPISMKDMCTIEDISLLIDAKVDSFKIEGRMKSPLYSAGVSEIYRKYADQYIESGKIHVSKSDMNKLAQLYVRTNLQKGYLSKYRGADMISFSSPAYNSVPDDLLINLENKYIDARKIPVDILVSIEKDHEIYGRISFIDKELSFEGYYGMAEAAMKKATDSDTVIKQMSKLGNSYFVANNVEVYSDDSSFVAVSELNGLRRFLVDGLLSMVNSYSSRRLNEFNFTVKNYEKTNRQSLLYVAVSNQEQLKAVDESIDADAYIVDLYSDIFDKTETIDKDIYIRLPAVIRQYRLKQIKDRLTHLMDFNPVGIFVNSLDGLNIAKEFFSRENIIADIGIPVFNDRTADFIMEYVSEYTVNPEHNSYEIHQYKNKINRQILLYGYLPVMYSANCIINSCDKCNNSLDGAYIADEKGRRFFSQANHELCYNTIYNNVPICMFKETDKLSGEVSNYRIEFTRESVEEVKAVISAYLNKESLSGNNSYTLGHYKRGVE